MSNTDDQIFPDSVCSVDQTPSELGGKDKIYHFNPRLFTKWRSAIAQNEDEFIAHLDTTNTSPFSDPIRDMLGKFWTLHSQTENQITFAHNPTDGAANTMALLKKIEENDVETFEFAFPESPFNGRLSPFLLSPHIRTFTPQPNNIPGTEKFSDTEEGTGIPINRETILILTDKEDANWTLPLAQGAPSINAWGNFQFKEVYEKLQADSISSILRVARHKEDHVFISSTPYEMGAPETPDSIQNGNLLYVGIESNYNFYSPHYENLLTTAPTILESLLPSLLIAGANQKIPNTSEEAEQGDDFSQTLADSLDDHLTLHGLITIDADKGTPLAALEDAVAWDPNVAPYELKGKYFERWTRAWKAGNSEESIASFFSATQNKYRTQVILPGTDFYLADYAPRKKQFPMDITLHFGTPQKGYSHDLLQTIRGCTDRQLLSMVSEFTLLDLIDYYDLRWPLFKSLTQKTRSDITESVPGKVEWRPYPNWVWEPKDYSNTKGLWDEYNDASKERIVGDTLGIIGTPQTNARMNATSRETLNFYRGNWGMTDAAGQPRQRSWLNYFKQHGSEGANQADFPNYDETGANAYAVVGSVVDVDLAIGSVFAQPVQLHPVHGVPARIARCEGLSGALNKLAKIKTRTFKEILEGKVACSETVGFRVEKIILVPQISSGPFGATAGFTEVEAVVQNFFLPYPRDKVLEFVDTQVKYDKKYKYKIYAYKAVFGTEYVYDFPWVQNIGAEGTLGQVKSPIGFQTEGGETKYGMVIDVISKPSIKIIEVPYHEFSPIRVVDRLPMAPNVEILPYKGKNNNYLINLESATGREVTLPIGIKDSDVEIFQKQYEAQYGGYIGQWREEQVAAGNFIFGVQNVITDPADESGFGAIGVDTLEYKSDDPPSSFEVFRLDTPPTSYSDFAAGSFIEIPTEGVTSVSLRPAELGPIEPNKKYYYTFRTKDVHGNISNPTLIYEVVNIDDGGAVYLVVKAYEFPKRQPQPKKTMKKFLSISPALDQTTWTPPVNEDGIISTYLNEDPVYGAGLEDPLLDNNRQYKIRLTSKQTGRKVDINVKFKSKKITTAEETDTPLDN